MDWLPISKQIRDAADALEAEMSTLDEGTRRWAECRLAWHKLNDAHVLLTSKDPDVDAMLWGHRTAKEIARP